jgi:hypothetical protein
MGWDGGDGEGESGLIGVLRQGRRLEAAVIATASLRHCVSAQSPELRARSSEIRCLLFLPLRVRRDIAVLHSKLGAESLTV